jgi:hypothetical protein
MGRIVTSFDIGIRHLAYCRMEYLPQNLSGDQFKIHDWDCLDLLEGSIDFDKKCQFIYKSGQKNGCQCTNDAYYNINLTGQSVCKTHAKSYSHEEIVRIYTCKNISLFELARIAVQYLDKIDFGQSNEIIFETQPRFNPKMKNFSMMLFNYFIIRYVAEKPAHLQTVENIKFISSKNKLSVYDGPYVECKLKNQYSRNKFYGKVYCRYIIRSNNERVAFFDRFKKKDDLADCFLQGAWHLMDTYKGSKITQQLKPKLKLKLKLKISSNFVEDPVEESNLDPAEESNIDPADESNLDPAEESNLNPVATILPKPKIVLKSKIVLKPQLPKIVISNPTLIGKAKLAEIKKNSTTRQVRYDYNLTKYQHLKRGIKAKLGAYRYTLSNIKYIIEKSEKSSLIDNEILKKSITYYFGNQFEISKLLI